MHAYIPRHHIVSAGVAIITGSLRNVSSGTSRVISLGWT